MKCCEECGRILASETSECPDCTLTLSEQPNTQRTSTNKPLVKSGNNGGAVIAFCAFAPTSLIFMMWWGYGGFNAVTPKVLHSLFAQIAIYLLIELICVHCLLFWATKATRMGAVLGFLSPWSILILMAIPQISSAPRDAFLIFLLPVLGLSLHVLAEEVFRKATMPNPSYMDSPKKQGN